MTDCKSLYDHLKVDGRVPDCRQTALYVSALRQVAAAGPRTDDKLKLLVGALGCKKADRGPAWLLGLARLNSAPGDCRDNAIRSSLGPVVFG